VIEKIQEKYLAQVEQNRTTQAIRKDLRRIKLKVEKLEEESELNTHGMQVAEEKIDPVVKRYFHLQENDPEFVEDYFKS
jgi:fructose-1-phosphate kinase PfkB-like protein